MQTHVANDIIDVTVDVAQGLAGGKSRLVQEGLYFIVEQAIKAGAKHAKRKLQDNTPVRTGAMKANIKTRVTRTKTGAKAEVAYEKPPGAKISYAGVVNAGGKRLPKRFGKSRVAHLIAQRTAHHIDKRLAGPHASRVVAQLHHGGYLGPHKEEKDIGFIDGAIEASKEIILNATINTLWDGAVWLIEESGVYLLEGAAIATL